jgi:dipeptidyl aminopeptidase/acylaminoacyl peptidase
MGNQQAAVSAGEPLDGRGQALRKRQIVIILAILLLCATAVPAQTGEIAPGDNLVLDGIPKVPASVAEAVARYTEFRTGLFLDWHPTRREMLIRTRFGDTTQIHSVTSPGGDRTQLTFFPDNVLGEVSYYPLRGEYFVFAKDVGGDQRFQKYRYDLATGDITLITDGKSVNRGGVWSHDGNRLAYVSTRRNGVDEDVYVVDPSNPSSDRMIAVMEGPDFDVVDWSPDDKKIVVCKTVSVEETELWLIDVPTGEKKLLTPRVGSQRVMYGNFGSFSKDGKGIYVLSDRDSDFSRLAYLELPSGKPTYLTKSINWNVENFSVSPDGRSIAFLVNADGVGTLHLLDIRTGKERLRPNLPSGNISNIIWHKNGRDLAFNLASAKAPADVYSLDVKLGKVQRWTFSETGGLKTASFPQPELIRWKSFDGRVISGFLYLPPPKFTGPRPVMISIHGGPAQQARPGYLGRQNYYLNEMGVAIIFPNVRGSNGYGKTFIHLDDGFLREDSYKDIGSLLDWIATRHGLDKNRVMVTGASYGGHATLAVASMYADRIRCTVESYGMSSLVTFLQSLDKTRQDFRRTEFGDEREPKMRAFLERLAPLSNSDKITKPMFFVYGKNDPRTPLSEAEQIITRVKKNGTPTWYLLAKDEGHGFVKKKNVDFLFYATVMFMREYLLN